MGFLEMVGRCVGCVKCRAVEIFCGPAGQVASPFEFPCRRKRGSRFLCLLLLDLAFHKIQVLLESSAKIIY
jgi:hypothetical protein